MSGFVFNTSASVICEPGAVKKLDELTLKTVGRRVLLITDKGLVGAGLIAPVIARLEAAGIDVAVFDEVVADPPEAIVIKAAQTAKKQGAEGVIGLGGGSSLDVAKLVALLVGGSEQLADIYGVGMVKGKRLPLILIPTTAGTGSEVTPISIITTGEAEKKGVVAPELLPDVAVLDAELTLGLPAHVTAATGIDAMVHAIEAYTSTSANNNPLSKVLAKEALRLLGANIEQAVNQPQDKDARSNMLLGSMLAGQAFANSPVAAVHALAYPIGGIFHVPHGVSNALVLPHVMRFNLPVCEQAYAELAPLVFPELSEVPAEKRAGVFIDRLAELSKVLGLETKLREVGIAEEHVVKLASEAMKQSRLLVNNPREVSEDNALQIYHQAL
ncbi:1,3-propanediol dehydrogenase [Pseudovibrio axinellae]|uniref:Alcohol dehydrogenase 2 n=1 Tax=Pseudovibrio axinellae TaxID=989403 RepID=A0A165YBD8_9HYPH|nr:iron-containing alcohol dehydrogenase [Pseudovibrio axinellae]KZL18637.1 1,3-propanediol dehydrogenase [Pseudovibrio axinellae]SER73747.1 Alcohol dehydrogenase, class IV [Pseudovibrio axinellae]